MKKNGQADRNAGGGMRALGLAVVAVLAAASLPAAATGSPAPPAAASRGERTTFHFQDIPVRSALQLLAEEGQFNLVVSDSVKGTISLHLTDVTWEQALDVVLRLKGLEQHVDGRTRAVTAKAR